MPSDSNSSPSNYQAPVPQYVVQAPKNPNKSLAIASLIIGIISIPTFGLLVIGAIVGITLGIVALTKASNNPLFYGGKGMAIGGIITSIISLITIPVIGLIGSIALPALLKATRTAHEQAAINALQNIHRCQSNFKNQNGRYASLRELADGTCLKREYALTPVNGYLYYDAQPTAETYCIRAESQQSSNFSKTFNITESGIIRVKIGEIGPGLCGEGEPISNAQ